MTQLAALRQEAPVSNLRIVPSSPARMARIVTELTAVRGRRLMLRWFVWGEAAVAQSGHHEDPGDAYRFWWRQAYRRQRWLPEYDELLDCYDGNKPDEETP